MNSSLLVGGAWLMAHHGLKLVMPLPVLSRIGGRRSTQAVDGITTETFVETMRPSAVEHTPNIDVIVMLNVKN